MRIADFSVKRPITTWMGIGIVVLLGVVALGRLNIDLMPKINPPVMGVITLFPGASPQEVAKMVSEPLEGIMNTCTNIKQLSSVSQENVSIIVGEFTWGTPMQDVRADLADKLARLQLPEGAQSPQIIRYDPSMLPVMQISVSSKNDPVQVKSLLETRVKPRLESLNGVASVVLSGAPLREISAELNQDKLNEYNLTQAQVVQVIQANNLNLPADVVKKDRRQLNVRVLGRFNTVDELKKLTVTMAAVDDDKTLTALAPSASSLLGSGLGIKLNLPGSDPLSLRPVLLEEVAEVKDGYAAESAVTRTNGVPSIGLTVQKEGDANLVNVARLLEKELAKVQQETPEANFTVTYNQATYINQAIANVNSNLVVGGLLAVAVLWVFLRTYKSTMIIALSIPFSIIATFALLYFSKITLNLMSLGGLALGVGMLVDNSIVVIESIYQHLEQGEEPSQAAMNGTNEVAGAITSSTLTTVAVFLPIVFVGGMAGDIFKELALTVSFSLLASLVVAVTVVPMLAAYLLRLPQVADRGVMSKVERLPFYTRCLRWALRRPLATMSLTLVALLVSLICAPYIGTEFLPTTDEGSFRVTGKLLEGTPLAVTDDTAKQVEALLDQIPELKVYNTTVGSEGQAMFSLLTAGSNEFNISATLKPQTERKHSTNEVVGKLTRKIKEAGLQDVVDVREESLTESFGASGSLEMTILAATSEEVTTLSQAVKEKMGALPGLVAIEDNQSLAKPEIDVAVDRSKSMSFALTPAQVGMVVRGALSGEVATQYDEAGVAVAVRVRYREQDRATVTELGQMLVKSPLGPSVPLQEIANIREGYGPVSLSRENGQPSTTLTIRRQGLDLGGSQRQAEELLRGVAMPPGARVEFSGAVQMMQEGFKDLRLAMALAICLVYAVMAAQFESLRHPLIIMLTIPLAVIGVVLGLVATHRALGVTAVIGIIMLAGIVVNNAIVLVDCINQRRASGMDLAAALTTAGQARLRPILMTTITTVLGLLPLALGIGEGAELQAPLATVVIGGLISSTILTLVIIPVIYMMVEGKDKELA